MFVHKIEYVDFNGSERKEDFYFHLSKPEVIRLEAEVGKPIDVHVKELTDNQELKSLLDFMERIILSSYGQKTTDGKSFRKSQGLREEFEYSNAYAQFFEQILTNQDLARRFAEGVIDNASSKKNQVAPTVVNS